MSEETEISNINITPPNSPNLVEKNNYCEDEDQETYEITLTQRWFVCLGEAKLEKVHLHDDSYIKNKELNIFDEIRIDVSKSKDCKLVSLFNNPYDLGTAFLYCESLENLFRQLRNEMLYLQDAAKLRHTDFHTLADLQVTQDHMKARRNCVKMFLSLREYLSCLYVPRYFWINNNFLPKIEEQLNGFRIFLGRLSDLPEYVLHHSAQSNGKKCTEAAYHLYHSQLDALWLHLTSLYLVERCRRAAVDEATASQHSEASSVSSAAANLEQNITALIADLLQLAVLRFEKTDVRSLLIKSPFSCSCVVELFVLVSVLANRLHDQGIGDKFWSIFNKVMEKFLNPGEQRVKPNSKTLIQTVTLPCSNPYGFALWMLKHVAMVHTYDEKCRTATPVDNYSLLETIIKGLLSSEVSEAHMRVYLVFIEKILIKYWNPDTKPIILLWEYFQKRLNSTFYVPGASIDSIAVMSQSVAGMVKQVKSRLCTPSSCDNSFQIFLRIMGLYLQKVSGQTQHWNQIRGRIYSKLSASKVSGLNETGLYHLVTLLLTCSITADLSEVTKKLQSLLDGLPEAELDVSVRRLVWRSQLAVCLLLGERGLDVTPALAPLTARLGQPLDISLYRTFLDGVRDILEASPTLRVDYTMLIGPWIPKYLAESSPNDSSRLLETLGLLIQRVQGQPFEAEKFQSCLWQHLGPWVRQRVGGPSHMSQQLADTCLSLCLPQWDTGREVVQLMLSSNITHISIVRRFLSRLVLNDQLLAMLKAGHPGSLENHEVLIIKSWLRCNLLSVDFKDSELGTVTRYITTLPFISGICMDLPTANDPLVHFIVNVSNKVKASQDIMEKSRLRKFMSCVLEGLDQWVAPHVRQPSSAELVARIYHVVGLIVSLLPTFIYMKSRPKTVLKGLLDIMFLPQCAYKADYEPPLKAVIGRELHLYCTGLADLSLMNDPYITRCMEDLLRIYLPSVSGQPQCRLHEVIQRADGPVTEMLNTICKTFIKKKTASPHPHCAQALKFLRSVVKLYSRDRDVMRIIVNTIFEPVCDILMFCDEHHSTKNIAREIMTLIFESYCFGDEMSILLVQKFDHICQEHLPFVPKNVFGLFTSEVLKHRPELISRFLPKLRTHINVIEQKRGFTFDRSLRTLLEDLERKLENLKRGP